MPLESAACSWLMPLVYLRGASGWGLGLPHAHAVYALVQLAFVQRIRCIKAWSVEANWNAVCRILKVIRLDYATLVE